MNSKAVPLNTISESGNNTGGHRSRAVGPIELFATGIAGLDDVLGGGLARNHLYLVEGEPGTGKTTLAMQFLMEGIRCGQKSLYVSLSESKAELLEIADSHGWSIDGIDVFELAADESDLTPEAQYTVFNPTEVELTDTTNALLAERSPFPKLMGRLAASLAPPLPRGEGRGYHRVAAPQLTEEQMMSLGTAPVARRYRRGRG